MSIAGSSSGILVSFSNNNCSNNSRSGRRIYSDERPIAGGGYIIDTCELFNLDKKFDITAGIQL